MLRAQQWNSQIWLSGWWKASVTRGGDAKRALLTKVFTHNLDIFRDGAYRTETDRVVTLPVSGAFVENSEMFCRAIGDGSVLHAQRKPLQPVHIQKQPQSSTQPAIDSIGDCPLLNLNNFPL